MNDTLKKLSDEVKTSLISNIATKAVIDLIASTKSSDNKNSGSFKVIVSTSDVDRQGESVNQAGWDLTFYKANPIVLWAHDYSALPIGICLSIDVSDGKLIAEGKFAPADANPFAQQVRKLYDLGMINTTSVGFIPKEYDGTKQGVISKSELLEFSFVPVPANPYALRLNQIKELGIDTLMLKTKGIEVKEEPEQTSTQPVKSTEQPKEIKGEVSERLEEMKKTKWSKYRQVCDVMDALASCYFSEETPAEDFSKLVNEAADILKLIASGTSSDDDMKSAINKLYNNSIPLIIIRNHFALGIATMAEGKKDGKETKAVEQRSINVEALKEINNFVETRALIRSIDNSIEKVLRNFNTAARIR